jgi:hypothetical protein
MKSDMPKLDIANDSTISGKYIRTYLNMLAMLDFDNSFEAFAKALNITPTQLYRIRAKAKLSTAVIRRLNELYLDRQLSEEPQTLRLLRFTVPTKAPANPPAPSPKKKSKAKKKP